MSDNLICEHISVSRKQTWDECPQKYKYRYHLKTVSTEPVQPYFVYGKLVHKIAEEYVREQGQREIKEITKDCLTGKIEIEKNTPPPVLSSEYMNKLPEHTKNIKLISDRIGFDGHLEWPFYIDLQAPDQHLIKGFIDRLIIRGDKYFILDYKTTKKGFYRKNQNTIRKDLQLRCYARIIQKEFGAEADKIMCALYYLEGGDLISSKFDQESLESAEKEIHDTYKNIISTHPDEVQGRVGQQCSRCDYRKVCVWYSLT